MNETEVVAMAESLRRILAKIESGDLTASAATRYRVEGAVAALEVIIAGSSSLVALHSLTENDRLV